MGYYGLMVNRLILILILFGRVLLGLASYTDKTIVNSLERKTLFLQKEFLGREISEPLSNKTLALVLEEL